MPHFEMQYSRNLEAVVDVQALCDLVGKMMRSDGMFPVGGIRIRAIPYDRFNIADEHPDNMFLDMVLRLGAGRSEVAKKAAGQRLFDGVTQYLGALFDAPHVMVSFEIREIDPELSWKKNSIHARLRAQEAEK